MTKRGYPSRHFAGQRWVNIALRCAIWWALPVYGSSSSMPSTGCRMPIWPWRSGPTQVGGDS